MNLDGVGEYRSALVACECPGERARLAGLVKRLGFGLVVPVGCGKSMLGMAYAIEFDLILTEAGMPGGTVFELLDLLSDSYSACSPCIVVCGAVDSRVQVGIRGYARAQDHRNLSFAGECFSLFALAKLVSTGAHPDDAGPDLTSVRATREDLESAFSHGQIIPYFQALHCLSSGRLVGAEMLACWDHPVAGLLPPARFLALVKRRGLEQSLVDAMIAGASAMFEHPGCVPADFKVSINVSAGLARSAAWAQGIVERLRRERLVDRCIIEVTEDGGEKVDELLAGAVGQWRLRSVDCAMDDFGSGFSSFRWLGMVPFNIVKIGKETIWKAREDPAARTLMKSVVTVAREHNITVVAEGLETQGDIRLAKDAGCDIGQGFHSVCRCVLTNSSVQSLARSRSSPSSGSRRADCATCIYRQRMQLPANLLCINPS